MNEEIRNNADAARIGWEERFEDLGPWMKANESPAEGTPLISIERQGGLVKMTTACGALNPDMKREDWPEWPEHPASEYTTLRIDYDQEIDFDTYRYLVVRIAEKGTFALLSINGIPTKVCYAAGIHAQDLAAVGIAGKQRVTLSLRVLNSSNWITFAYIRLVNRLTEEERRGFIGEGLTIRRENQRSIPYHGLEAYNDRVGRPFKRDPLGGEWLVYRDSGTGAQVWKMTQGAETSHWINFNADGSAFTFKRQLGSGVFVFDWKTRSFFNIRDGMESPSPQFAVNDPSAMVLARCEKLEGNAHRYTLYKRYFRSEEETMIGSFTVDFPSVVNELAISPRSGKILWGFRETRHAVLIDPDEPSMERRIRRIELPTRLKGLKFGETDDEINWYNCYTYEHWKLNLNTGWLRHGPVVTGGGHDIGGDVCNIGPYADLLKLRVRNHMEVQTEADADDVVIFGNYRDSIETDYGHISRNGKYAVTDGVEGDIAGQHLMIPLNDPGTFMRAVFHHTSRNDWDTNTYSWPSPDATKIAWTSDQFDIGDICIAVAGLPAAPERLQAELGEAGTVKLSWQAPSGAREIAGYRIYRSEHSGYGFTALNDVPVADTAYVDSFASSPGKGVWYYLVAMVEPSGLEGMFSNEAAVRVRSEGATGAPEPRTYRLQAEQGEWRPPMREALHGDAEGSRYVRIHHASPEEALRGELRFSLTVDPGEYTLWLRGRAEDQRGTVQWEIGGFTAITDIDRPEDAEGKGQFRWIQADRRLAVREACELTFLLSAEQDGLAIDAVAVSSDASFVPDSCPLTGSPDPVTDLQAFEITGSSVKLRWKPCSTPNLFRYDIHVSGSGESAELGNATIIGSTTATEFEDWGLPPAASYTYRVVAVDSRGNVAAPAEIDVRTADQRIQTVVMGVNEAEADPRFTVAQDENGEYWAALPPDRQNGDPARMTFTMEIAEESDFQLWLTYRPAYVPKEGLVLGVEIDGVPAGGWQLRAPYAPMWSFFKLTEIRPVKTWTDKIAASGKDLFRFTPGIHTVSLIWDLAAGAGGHAVSRLYVSNDQAYRPQGYNPRANFTKPLGWG
jgi:hypothetical protein